MRKIVSSLLLVLLVSSVGAQNLNLTPEVVSSAGETFTNGTIYLDWTLGEIMTETFAGTIILTQGFHQPTITTTSINDPGSLLGTIKVYPNPTAGTLTVERDRSGTLSFVVLDIKGSRVLEKSVSTAYSELDLSNLPSGVYVLRMSDGAQAAQSIRIQKL